MFKYINDSGLRQGLRIKGKRIVMDDGDVIQSEVELMYVFLTDVTEENPETTIDSSNVRNSKFNKIKDSISDISVSDNDLKDMKAKLDSIEKKINKEMNDKFSNIDVKIEEVTENNKALKDVFRKFDTKTNRRLEILKSALQTIQDDIYEDEDEDDMGK